jgi:nanoRNase/pAp phosphatase (c-di-AMP/oligoRNAs hydrolase)
MTDADEGLRALLETLDPKARDDFRRVLIRDQADRDAISSRLDLAEVLRLAGRNDEAATALESAIELFNRKGNIVSARRAGELLAALRA